MGNEIKVGDYCRTKNGLIAKLIEPQVYEINDRECIEFLEDIVKHSSNLIDIIEVNDIGIMNYNGIVFQKFVSKDDIVALKLKEYKLLEILTKEQFESISYKEGINYVDKNINRNFNTATIIVDRFNIVYDL